MPAVGTSGDHAHGLDDALRDLAQAVRALQLYPPSSPVVATAVARAQAKLSAILRAGRLSLAVMPSALKLGEAEVAPRSVAVGALAEHLHQRGVAHLHLDDQLQSSGLQGLAELLVTDPDTLKEDGGIGTLCERRQLHGIRVDMLQLDKLYTAAGDSAERDTETAIWEQVLGSCGGDLGSQEIDWTSLANDPRQLADFLAWLLDTDNPPPDISEMSRVHVVRSVCERVGEAAWQLGSEQLDTVAEVIGSYYDELDKEIWIELLGQPLAPGTAGDPAGKTRPEYDEHDPPGNATAGAEHDAARLAHRVGATLGREQAEELLVYALTSRQEVTPRILGLFRTLLEPRDDRDTMQRAIRAAVERQVRPDADRLTLRELWPRLDEALHGEDIEPYVSTTYRAQMEQLLTASPAKSTWNLERIAPRLRELEPGYLLQRKSKVVLEILALESDDDDYRLLVEELERTLPELIVEGQYIAAEEILRTIAADLIPARGRTDRQRETAREVLIRFCNEHTLREVVRNLAGKPATQIDAAARIFNSLGPMAVPALVEALANEKSRPLRLHLVRMLSAIGDQALPEIRRHLRDKRWFFVRNLVWIIGQIGDARFVPHLSIIVNHPDVRVRRQALRSISKLRNEAAAKVLLGAVDDDDAEVRMIAIRGLGTSRAEGAVPRLRQLIKLPNRTGENTEIIRAAAIALGRIGAGDALSDLAKLARRPWLFRRRRVAACEAAEWAIAALRGDAAGDAPEPHRRRSGDRPPQHGGSPLPPVN